MTAKYDKPIELFRTLLRYEPETGDLFWKTRTVEHFQSQHSCNIWNTKYAGKKALTATGKHGGYSNGRILYRPYMAHIVAWAIFHGEWPTRQIDHINGVRTDNRIENLRDVTPQENKKNSKRPKNNTSGVCGVSWREREQKWHAQIRHSRKTHHIGSFADKAAATAARKQKEIELGFHPNHGRAA